MTGGDVTWRVAFTTADPAETVSAASLFHESPKDPGGAARWVLKDAAGTVVFSAPGDRVLYARRLQRPVAAELPRISRAELRDLVRDAVAAALDEDDVPGPGSS